MRVSSRSALAVVACLLVAVGWLALTPSVAARQLALIVRPGSPPEAMLAAAARLELWPIAQPAPWPVLIAATDEAGWQGAVGAAPYLFAIAVDGIGEAGKGFAVVASEVTAAPTDARVAAPRAAVGLLMSGLCRRSVRWRRGAGPAGGEDPSVLKKINVISEFC